MLQCNNVQWCKYSKIEIKINNIFFDNKMSLTNFFGLNSNSSGMVNNKYKSKYNLAVIEVYNTKEHGFDMNSSFDINTHFLCSYIYKPHKESYMNKKCALNVISRRTKNKAIIFEDRFYSTGWNVCNHDIIRNYVNVALELNGLQICQTLILKGYECVAILKTFWLKIVQRCWKKIFKARKILLQKRLHNMLYNNKYNYQYYGNKYKDTIPSIRGMFYYTND